jgi:hypothetical protein
MKAKIRDTYAVSRVAKCLFLFLFFCTAGREMCVTGLVRKEPVERYKISKALSPSCHLASSPSSRQSYPFVPSFVLPTTSLELQWPALLQVNGTQGIINFPLFQHESHSFQGISALFLTTSRTTANACLAVLLLVVSLTRASLLLMLQNVICRRVQNSPGFILPDLPSPQVNPKKYTGLGVGLRTLVAEEGANGIWKGFGPTFVGYSLQGMFKYGLYEIFKDYYMNLAGEELTEKYKPAIWLAGSASAEIFADIALCPLEMTKVKIQTSQNGTFPTGFGAALAEMRRTKVETRFPFGSLVPLWSRQVTSILSLFDPRSKMFLRYLIPWPSSSSLKKLSNFSTPTSSPNPKIPMQRPPSLALHSRLVTWPVLSAPSFHIPPTPLFPSSERPKIRVNQSAPSPTR